MFQFCTFAPQPLYIQGWVSQKGWVAPFGHPQISAWLPAPCGFSQVPTSFIASRRQDIHRVPLWPGRTNRTPRLSFRIAPTCMVMTIFHHAVAVCDRHQLTFMHSIHSVCNIDCGHHWIFPQSDSTLEPRRRDPPSLFTGWRRRRFCIRLSKIAAGFGIAPIPALSIACSALVLLPTGLLSRQSQGKHSPDPSRVKPTSDLFQPPLGAWPPGVGLRSGCCGPPGWIRGRSS
jgi:hypothetical protein